MNRWPQRRWIAVGTAAALLLQGVLSPAVCAFDETLPGGTSPTAPPSPAGGQGPAQHPSDQEPPVQADTDPVDLHRGDFVLTRQDVALPGRGLLVALTFTYRSRSSYNGPFGYGWDMTYNKRLKKLANNNLMLLRGTNRKDEFLYTGSTTYTPPDGIYDTLIQNNDGTYTLTSTHGDKERYDPNGNLTQIEDRNGNVLIFIYDPEGLRPISGKSEYFVNQMTGVIAREYRLTQITDTVGRTLTFTYTAEGRLGAITYEGRTITYTYDATGTGDLLSVTLPATPEFPSGTTTTYAYDARHNLTAITDANGQTYLTNVYDVPTDRVTSQTYGSGTSTILYSTDAGGNKTSEVIDRKGFHTFFTFDAAGHVTRQEEFTAGLRPGEPASYVTTYEYNAAGERTRIVYPRGNAIESTYDAKGNLLELRRKKIGAVARVPDPVNDVVTAFTYEPRFNLLKTLTGPRGHVTTYTYDYELDEESAHGNLRRITAPQVDGQTPETTLTYTAHGQVETVADPNGLVTRYAYDPATGQPSQITQGVGTADEASAVLAYDEAGNVMSLRNPNAATTQFRYNALNQLTATIAPAPFLYETRYRYDANGNLAQADRQATPALPGPQPSLGTTVPDDDWQSTVYTYTVLDQLASITDELGQTTRFSYDANGNRDTLTDAAGYVTTYAYDERDLLHTVTDAATPAGMTTSIYDANGNLTTLTDASGNPTTYAYDDFDRLKQTTYADGSYEDYAYDAASNLLSVDHGLSTIDYSYDALHRLTAKTTPEETTTYAYDAGSRLISAADSDATISYTYDALNRVKQVITDPVGPLVATTVNYTYDGIGNRLSLSTDYGLSTMDYSYDALNRLTQIKEVNKRRLPVAAFAYDALSRRSRLMLENGTQASYTYDAANRLLRIEHARPSLRPRLAALAEPLRRLARRLRLEWLPEAHADPEPVISVPVEPVRQLPSTLLAAVAYTYDALGNRRTQQVTPSPEPPALNQFTYDPLSQLVAMDDGPSTVDYAYDPVGNRTQHTDAAGSTAYTTNALNQYTTVGAAALTYDANGNLTSDDTRTYAYDAENRLLSIDYGLSTMDFKYDPFGRRLSKTVSAAGGSASGGNDTTTHFLYDGDQLLAELNSTGRLLRSYVYGTGIDEPLRMRRGRQASYYHADGLGSILALTDATGAVVERVSYDPFGTPQITDPAGTPRAVSAVGNRFLFTGREYDAETGLLFLRARYYNPTLGRFLSRDPLTWGPDDPRVFGARNAYNRLAWLLPLLHTTSVNQTRGSVEQQTISTLVGVLGRGPLLPNRYLYVGNNPLTWVDPFGLDKTATWWRQVDDWLMPNAYARSDNGLDSFESLHEWLSIGKVWVAGGGAISAGTVTAGAGYALIVGTWAVPGAIVVTLPTGGVLILGGVGLVAFGSWLVYQYGTGS